MDMWELYLLQIQHLSLQIYVQAVGTIENPVWFSFIPCETIASITIIPSNCQPGVNNFMGLQVAMYSECMEGESVACFDDGSDQDINLSFDSFIPGNIYYLIVDGYGG